MVQYVEYPSGRARNMQNFALLKKIGQCGKTVFLSEFFCYYQDLLMQPSTFSAKAILKSSSCGGELEPLRPTREIPWILRPFPFLQELHISHNRRS